MVYILTITLVYAAFAFQLAACMVPKRTIVLLLFGALVLSVFLLVVTRHLILLREGGPMPPSISLVV